MSHREEHLWRRNRIECVENFDESVSILRVNLSRHFEALCHFCVNEFEKFIFSFVGLEREATEDRSWRKKERSKISGRNTRRIAEEDWAWVTNITE